MSRKFLNGLVGFCMLLVLGACSDDDDDDNTTGPTDPETALVRVAHLVPDANEVDVWVNGTVVLEDVAFGNFSGYLELDEASYDVQVTLANQTTPFLIDEDVTVMGGTNYTIAATGTAATITASIFVDDLETSSDMAEIRFVHASPDAPPIDITLTDGTPLFEDIEFGASESTAVPEGSYDLQVRVAGTETVVLSYGGVAVSNGTNYSVIALGELTEGTLGAQVTVDAPGETTTVVPLDPAMAMVRVAHLSPDTGGVDIYVDGELVTALVNVPFKAVSDYLELSAATHTIEVYGTGSTTNPAISAPVTWLPGQKLTIAATGLSTDLQPLVLEDAVQDPGAGSSSVRFVHASPDEPAVDIVVADGGPTLFDNVMFRGVGDYTPVASATYDLEVRLDMGGALALEVPGVELKSDTSYTVFAVGLAGDSSLEALPVTD